MEIYILGKFSRKSLKNGISHVKESARNNNRDFFNNPEYNFGKPKLLQKFLFLLSLVFILLTPHILFGKTLLEFNGKEIPQKDTSLYEFKFLLSENGNSIVLNLNSNLEQGKLAVWLGGGGYEVIGNYIDEGRFSYKNLIFGPLNNTEPIKIRVTTENAVGNWHFTFTEQSRSKNLASILIAGILIIIISSGFIIRWKKLSGISLRWIFLGGGVWLTGVVLKFLFAFAFNDPILEGIKSTLGQTNYLSIGSIYIGLLTGVFEIGITFLFALFIKGMYENYRRGIGIGIGAGAIEAILIGFSQIGSFIYILSGQAGSNTAMAAITQSAITTPFLWLIGPVERIIAILCHTSSRALVLFCILKKKYIYFWAGFLIITAIDAIAGYVHLAGLVNKISMWWIELALLPFAIISIPIIKWCMKNWNDKKAINIIN